MKIEKTAEKLLQSIKKSTCSFTTASHAMERLENHGFEEISMQDEWVISEGGKYFLNIYDSGVLAFTVGSRIGGMLKIAAAHTDHPCLYLKPNPEMIVKGYGKVNVESYGGAI